MTPHNSPSTSLQLIIALVLLVSIIYGCANRMPPGGGPYDEKPPRLVSSSPAMRGLNVKGKKVILNFDEYVSIQDVTKKVIISPPQLQQPRITSVGKRIIVELEDDLIPNTTYTIDFTDAIVDNNEQNAFENFSYAFSTGSEIDTMELSGKVLYARNHEPVQGVIVGVHSAESGEGAFEDTTFLRMSRTSDRAEFVMRNLKNGQYRIYALKETDGNYRHDMPSEGIAFFDSLLTTTSAPAMRNDTIWKDTTTIDTVKQVAYTRYMPDDILLWFYEPVGDRRYLTKRERPHPHVISLTFNHPIDSTLTLSAVDSTGLVDHFSTTDPPKYVIDRHPSGQVDIFLTDSSWIRHSDFALSYMSTDSLEQRVMVTDTLKLKYRAPRGEIAKKSRREETDKEPEKPKSPFTVQVEHKGDGGRTDSILFSTSLPIDPKVFSAIQLYNANDSILKPLQWESAELLPGRTTRGLLRANLKYGSSYEIHFDSVAFRDVYGHTLGQEVVDAFEVKRQDEFSHLEITIHGVQGPFVVELLNLQDQPIRTVATTGATVKFEDLKPEKYALRIIQDSNGNGRWDEGSYRLRRQPEMVYYAPKTFELMKNWSVKENFYPLRTPLLRQKPAQLIKNKPEEKKKRNLNEEREREMQQRRQGGSGFNVGGSGGFGGGALGGFQNQIGQRY